MANTKVTQHVIANNAITADQISSAAVTDAKLHSTLDLSGKTLTLPATAIPSASTATTQAASDNSTKLATTAYVTTAIANLNDSAPTALNTLNELAAALGDDANFSATITTSIAAKLPLAGGTMTGNIAHAGDLTLDVGGDIILDADGGDIRFKDGGTEIGVIENSSSDLQIKSSVQDKDIIFRGNDGGSGINALTLDMSEAGFATFNDGGVFGGTGALRIPQGTTGQRPSAATGQIRWNTTDGALEVYNGSAWTAVGTGSSNKVLDTFTGNGSNATFTLSVTPANEDAIMVFIDGAYQEKSDYTLTNNSLVLDTAPLNNEKIAVHITTASVHDGTSAVNQQFTATAGQTAFTLSQDPSSENNTQVYINGVYQQKTDYTVSGTTLTFDTGLTVGDVVEVNMFTVATLGNTDTVTEGVGNLYHTTARARGAISVSGNALSYNSSSGVITANFEESPAFTGSVDVAGNITVGNNDSILAENNLRFKSSGAAYIDHNTTGQSIVFRTSNSSALDTQALILDHLGNLTIRSGGKLIINRTDNATGGEITYGPSAGTGFTFNDVNSDGIDFKTGSTMLMSIDSTNQKVGIGTDSPATLLHIKKAGSTSAVQEFIRIENNAGGGASAGSSINFHHYHAGGGPTGGAKAASITAQNMASWPGGTPSSYSTGLAFGTLHENTFAERMRISSNGKVGINVEKNGNSIPQKTFHVEHTAGASEGILISGASDTAGHTAGILLRAEGGEADSSLRAKGAIFFERTGTYGVGKLHLANNIGADNTSATLSHARMTLDTDGTISTSGDFKPGADVIMNNGRGISFSATANASTAGTSMGSELLDDYEEGTFSPTIIAGTTNPTGGSNLSPTGHYVKIGRQVWVAFYVGVSWTNSPSGGIYVNRLPFTIANNSNNNSHPSATTYNFGTGTGESPFLSPQLGQTNARLYMMGPAGWGAADFASHVSSPLYITGQFTYFTT
jgi:hypothetical protein